MYGNYMLIWLVILQVESKDYGARLEVWQASEREGIKEAEHDRLRWQADAQVILVLIPTLDRSFSVVHG
jgi:hypothetical protein